MTLVDLPGFTLKVLGGFRLDRSGVPIDLPAGKLACLLTYLACTAPVPQSREKLANLLWGAHSDERARHNLRQALARLRQLLGPDGIVNGGEAVLLAPGAIACDAVRFDRLIRENTAASIAAAAEMYEGALLEDVAVAEVGWNEWLLRERDRLRERAIDAMVAQGERALASGGAESATRYGRRAVALDNFREDAHRLVLRGLAAAGRYSEAVRHYQDFVAFLKAELNAQPDGETSQLVGMLGRGGPSHGSPGLDDATGQIPPQSGQAPREMRNGDEAGVPISNAAFISPHAPERRPVTILACNAAAALSPPGIDPEDIGDAVSSFRKMAADMVERFGGCVISGLGDAVHACFGYPETRERDAIQAVRVGIAIIQAAEGLGALSGRGLQASVGIATGLVAVEEGPGPHERERPGAIGEAPALALHLQTLAAPGAIIVSRETRLLLEPMFDLRPIDAIGPLGAADRLEAWQVCGERDEVGHSDSGPDSWQEDVRPRLISRQEEYELLRRRWDQVRRGQGRVVLLSGEPGIGKSYLAGQFLLALEENDPAHLRYFCSPHHAMRPLHPYIRQVERSAGLSSAGSPAEKLDRLAASIESISTDAMRDVALMGELLMLPADERYPALTESPQRKRELVMASYLEQLRGRAAQRPVVVLFEDIHWIDPTSLDLLDRTVAQIAHLPVLLIATFRPEHQPAWAGQPHVTLLHLNRFDREDSAALVREVFREKPLPQPIVDQIVDRTDGVPLFIKEMSRHVLESGLPTETAEGHVPDGALPPFSIPTKLQATLAVRLERLGTARKVALIGSVIGRTFSRDLIAGVGDAEFADLDEALDRLTASGLMSRRGTLPNASYAFTHALVHNAAYDMVPEDQRRRLHSKIANVLIDRFPTHAAGSPEIIGHHLAQAGRTAEAADYWIKAGRSAHARWANRECADFFDLALHAIDELPKTAVTLRQAVDLCFEIKNALIPLGEFDRVVACLRKAQISIAQLGDRQRLCQFYVHMCQALGMSGKSNEAIAFGLDAERLADSLSDRRLQVEAAVFLAMAYYTVVDYRRAERLLLRVLQLLEDGPSGQRFALAGFPEVTAGAFLTRINAVWGEFERGISHGEKALRQAENLEQPYSLSLSIWCLADLHLTRGDVARAIALFERGLAVAKRGDLPFLVAGHSGSLGYAYALTNRADEGLPLIEQAMSVFEKMRHQLALSLFLVPLGEAYVLAGRLDQAGDVARHALTLSQESGHGGSEAGSHHILADIAARTGLLDEAEIRYRDALALAEDLGMRPLIARCRHGLANVSLRKADPQRARADLMAATTLYREMGMEFWLGSLLRGPAKSPMLPPTPGPRAAERGVEDIRP